MLPGLGSDFTNSVLFTAFSTAKLVAGIESCVKYVVCKIIQYSVKVGATMLISSRSRISHTLSKVQKILRNALESFQLS